MQPNPDAEPATAQALVREHTRTGTSVEALKRALLDNLLYFQGRFPDVATLNDCYQALAYTAQALSGAGRLRHVPGLPGAGRPGVVEP